MKILKNLVPYSFALLLTPIISNSQEMSQNHNYIDKSLALIQSKIKDSRAEYDATMNSQLKPFPILVDFEQRLDSLFEKNSTYQKNDYTFSCFFEDSALHSYEVNSKGTMIEIYYEEIFVTPLHLLEKIKVTSIENGSRIDSDGQTIGYYLFKLNNGTRMIIEYNLVDGEAQIVGEQLSARIHHPGEKYSVYGVCVQNK